MGKTLDALNKWQLFDSIQKPLSTIIYAMRIGNKGKLVQLPDCYRSKITL